MAPAAQRAPRKAGEGGIRAACCAQGQPAQPCGQMDKKQSAPVFHKALAFRGKPGRFFCFGCEKAGGWGADALCPGKGPPRKGARRCRASAAWLRHQAFGAPCRAAAQWPVLPGRRPYCRAGPARPAQQGRLAAAAVGGPGAFRALPCGPGLWGPGRKRRTVVPVRRPGGAPTRRKGPCRPGPPPWPAHPCGSPGPGRSG